MRQEWTAKAGLGVCSIIFFMVLSNISWAKPKQTYYYSCKCTCMWQDELGKEHFGQADGVEFTESSLEKCLNHKCKAGTHTGVTRNCTGTEKPKIMVPSEGLPGAVLQTSPSSGGAAGTPAGGVNRPDTLPGSRTP